MQFKSQLLLPVFAPIVAAHSHLTALWKSTCLFISSTVFVPELSWESCMRSHPLVHSFGLGINYWVKLYASSMLELRLRLMHYEFVEGTCHSFCHQSSVLHMPKCWNDCIFRLWRAFRSFSVLFSVIYYLSLFFSSSYLLNSLVLIHILDFLFHLCSCSL